VKSHRLARGSCIENAEQQLKVDYLGYSMLPLILHGRILVYFTLLVCMFDWVRKMIDLTF
jgi:hypothetical protein